jgi:STE24 endopeptidase
VDVGADGDAHGGRIVYSVPTRLRLPLAVLTALAAAEAAVLRLRPRERPEPVGVAARDYFSAAELDRARAFRGGQRRLGWARTVVSLAVLGTAARRPPVPSGPPVRAGAATAAALGAGLTLADLPLRAWSRQRANDVGLVTQGWAGWAGDLAKSVAIESVLSAAGGALTVAGMRRFGPRWWLPAAGAGAGFAALTTTLAPLVLDPVFNRFDRLPDGPLRDDVLALAERAGVRVGEVYEVDASRRTTAANAYVTGLGPTKRVVLFDTLLRDFPPADVRLVVAHELAHVRFRDVARGLALLAVVAPPGAYAVARLGEGIAPPGAADGPAALPALVLAAGLLGSAVSAIGAQLSRAIEVRADAFALALTGEPAALVGFERRIALSNVIDPDPPRMERLFASHPSTVERIGLALAAA